jgi:hypothetical protein
MGSAGAPACHREDPARQRAIGQQLVGRAE